MIPYCKQYISDSDVLLFETISRVVQNMRDIDLGVDEKGELVILSCHMLARAVGKLFCLTCVDGYFHVGYEHSWVVTPEGHIIDVYPVGVLGGPILCVGGRFSPYNKIYNSRATRIISAGRFSSRAFRRSVERIKRELVRSCEELMGKA